MPQKLTELLVANAKSPVTGRRMIWDALLPGFGLRVTDKGAKSWVVMYRLGGREAARQRLTLGKYPAFSLANARTRAREILEEVAKGNDPAAAEADDESPRNTVDAICDEFVERYAKPRNRSWKETKRILDMYVKPEWGARLITDISRRHIIELLDAMVDRGAPVMAKQTHSTVRKLLNWAVDRGVISASPCLRIPPPARANDRDRVLSDDELRSVWNGCDRLGWPFCHVVRLLMLTGQRREEIATMRWPDIDIGAASWTLPRSSTKNKRGHEVPLAPAVVSILKALPKVHDELVFTTNGRVPVAGSSIAKRRLDTAVATQRADASLPPIADWHLHDLRRTMASGMARLRIAPHVIEKVLNHQSGVISGVAAIYNRHSYQDEKRQALETWSSHVSRLVSKRRRAA
jgi:integrase